jgi:ATP-dependent protease ClpP protease subunit
MVKIPKNKVDQILHNVHEHQCNGFSREIFLHSHYSDDDPGVEYRMATTFVKNMRVLDADNTGNILIHMHSPGGEWNDGMAMFNAIVLAKNPVTIVAYGYAASMSSIMLQAADIRIMMPDTDFMIHYGNISEANNYLAFISSADREKKVILRMLKIYAKRCIVGSYFKTRYKSLDEDKVISFLERKIKERGDWWLTAEESVYYGFADGILGTKGFENIDTDKVRVTKKFCW